MKENWVDNHGDKAFCMWNEEVKSVTCLLSAAYELKRVDVSVESGQ